MTQQPFIVVFRPHQRPAWAEAYNSEDVFIRQWQNGSFDRSCFCNNNLSEEASRPTFENAWDDAGHDLHAITRLDSVAEVRAYLKNPGHNPALSDVRQAAADLGWL